MLTAQCGEPGCTWTFASDDRKLMDVERDRHFMTHPWDRTSGAPVPRFPALSDDTEVSTGHVYRPRADD